MLDTGICPTWVCSLSFSKYLEGLLRVISAYLCPEMCWVSVLDLIASSKLKSQSNIVRSCTLSRKIKRFNFVGMAISPIQASNMISLGLYLFLKAWLYSFPLLLDIKGEIFDNVISCHCLQNEAANIFEDLIVERIYVLSRNQAMSIIIN